MVFTQMVLIVILLAISAPLSGADIFLQARIESQLIPKEDVERLWSKLSAMATSAQLRNIKADLRTMFLALPKNQKGYLEPTVVRYALHRYFVFKHGWYMSGLDSVGGAWDEAQPAGIMKGRAPAYIQGLFHQRLKGGGFGLRELALFAAVLSDLVHREVSDELHSLFTSMKLPTSGPIARHRAEHAIKAYLARSITESDLSTVDYKDLKFAEQKLVRIYPDWPSISMWVEDTRKTHDMMLLSQRNPFVPGNETFESTVVFMQELWHRFGSFQDLDCKALKSRLLEMEHDGSGRVRLSRFYEGAMSKGDWTLSESASYLRKLGTLDESDSDKPSVVIANYLTSQTNCLSASGFYAVCCYDECEGLLQHLEKKIAASIATPSRIAQLVSELQSDTVHAPRNLSSTLLARLDEIAKLHGGPVPLHGRLFAQWMHHVYPRECSFPHVAGSTAALAPSTWLTDRGGRRNSEATLEEMRWHYSRLDQEVATKEQANLPWTDIEQLVGGEPGPERPTSGAGTVLRCMMVSGLSILYLAFAPGFKDSSVSR